MFTNFLNMWLNFKKLRKTKKRLDTKGFIPLGDLNFEQRYRRAHEKAKQDIEDWPNC